MNSMIEQTKLPTRVKAWLVFLANHRDKMHTL
jgi:hypothetical protein